MYFSY